MTKKRSSSKNSTSPWLGILRVLGLALTVVTIMGFVLLLAVPYIHPEHVRRLAWIGLGMPFVVYAMWVWLVVWMVARERSAWVILAVALLVTFPIWRRTVVMNFGGNYPSKEAIAKGHELKILTYNIEMFSEYNNADSILDIIEEGNYDIVCLQEFGHYSNTDSKWKNVKQRLDEMYEHRHIWYKNQSSHSENGLVLFSHHPIVNKVKVKYNSLYNITVYSDVKVGDDTIRIFNNHLESNKLTRRDRTVAEEMQDENVDYKTNYRSLRRVLAKIADASIIRASQADSISAIIAETPYPVIVLGDFNDVPQSYAYTKLIGSKHLNSDASFTDAYAAAGAWLYYRTYNQNHLDVPIDHILVSDEFDVMSCEILPQEFSDHYPVTATLLLK